MNILELNDRKRLGQKLTMVTCYDFWSARLLAESPIDFLLVGDSAGMVMHGLDDTIGVTVEQMATHVRSVRKGAPKKFIVADLPFLSFRGDLQNNMDSVRELVQAGAHAVKLEGQDAANQNLISHLVSSGVPVMGHLGLTPQFVHALGGFKVQGRERDKARRIVEQAQALEQAGCFSIVLECVPSSLATEITSQLRIPTIGIGAGSGVDGQVLVLQDLLGFSQGHRPKFVRTYLPGADLFGQAIANFYSDVTEGKFPSAKESYE